MNIIHESAKLGDNVVIGIFTIVEEGVIIGDNTKIGPHCTIRKNVNIGENCSFTAYNEIRENVTIGKNTSFGSRCTISANAKIGENVTLKYGFVLTDTPNLQEGNIKSVGDIGENTLIGANVCLMPGTSIGKNCIVGACSQVRHNIPNNEIWYGSPAIYFKTNK